MEVCVVRRVWEVSKEWQSVLTEMCFARLRRLNPVSWKVCVCVRVVCECVCVCKWWKVCVRERAVDGVCVSLSLDLSLLSKS